MSYREENGQVVLTLSRDDYDRLLLTLGAGSAGMIKHGADLDSIFSFADRLNEGNPNYRPYKIGDEKTARGQGPIPPDSARSDEA